jgi:hypothetical protein
VAEKRSHLLAIASLVILSPSSFRVSIASSWAISSSLDRTCPSARAQAFRSTPSTVCSMLRADRAMASSALRADRAVGSSCLVVVARPR